MESPASWTGYYDCYSNNHSGFVNDLQKFIQLKNCYEDETNTYFTVGRSTKNFFSTGMLKYLKNFFINNFFILTLKMFLLSSLFGAALYFLHQVMFSGVFICMLFCFSVFAIKLGTDLYEILMWIGLTKEGSNQIWIKKSYFFFKRSITDISFQFVMYSYVRNLL